MGSTPARRRSAPRFLVITVLLASMLGTGACTSQTGADEQTRTGSDTGFLGGSSLTRVPPAERAPAAVASGNDLADGSALSSADFPDKIIVLNVWGSWCAPCRKEAPDLVAASRETAEVAQFLGINVRDLDPAPARAFVRAFKVTYPNIYDPKGEVLLRYAGDLPPSGIPATLILDPDGRLAARIIGTITETTLVQLITDIEQGR